MIVDGTLNDAAERLKNFDSFARVRRGITTLAPDRDGGETRENPLSVRQRDTFDRIGAGSSLYYNSSLRQTTRLTASQTLLAIILAVINFVIVYVQDKIGGKTNAALIVGGASLLIGSTIPYARCC